MVVTTKSIILKWISPLRHNILSALTLSNLYFHLSVYIFSRRKRTIYTAYSMLYTVYSTLLLWLQKIEIVSYSILLQATGFFSPVGDDFDKFSGRAV